MNRRRPFGRGGGGVGFGAVERVFIGKDADLA